MTVDDPVGTADRLRAGVAERIAGELAGAAVPVGDVYLGWGAALEAATCPARYRAQGAQGWAFPGWSPPLAAGACGRAALAHHMARADLAGRPATLPTPLDAIRAWMRSLRTQAEAGARAAPPVERSSVGDWIAETWAAGDSATLAAVAATAGRWLAGFIRVLGWPLPTQLTLLNAPGPVAVPAPSWRPDKASPVTVACGADGRIGKVTGAGGFVLVVHRVTTGGDGALRDRAAFEAAAGSLAIGVVPASVLVTAGDTGERVTAPVDHQLLALGANRIVAVVTQRAIAAERGFDPADATPSPACRRCDHLADCPPGQAWMAAAGRWRGGLPVIPPVRAGL
ncbi:MAG TPA: hypothetical protein VFH30_07790 [Acidimicrobiales bacterium]|nr:hypothetical protein [Acidimicrobiales bacterium]